MGARRPRQHRRRMLRLDAGAHPPHPRARREISAAQTREDRDAHATLWPRTVRAWVGVSRLLDGSHDPAGDEVVRCSRAIAEFSEDLAAVLADLRRIEA